MRIEEDGENDIGSDHTVLWVKMQLDQEQIKAEEDGKVYMES